VNAIKEISGSIEKLSEISSTIAAGVEEQGAATQEISRNVPAPRFRTELAERKRERYQDRYQGSEDSRRSRGWLFAVVQVSLRPQIDVLARGVPRPSA
jgi:hypothetical protein